MCINSPYFCLHKQDKIVSEYDLEFAVFCKIPDGQLVMLPWKQKL